MEIISGRIIIPIDYVRNKEKLKYTSVDFIIFEENSFKNMF